MSEALPADAIEVARVLGAWGVKGWLKIQPYAEDPQALFSSKRWYLMPAESQAPARPGGRSGAMAATPSLLKVIQAKEHGDGVVANVQDVEDRDAAEALRGVRIFVSRASFPTAADDEFYWVDLIGLDVFNVQGEALGVVEGLLDTGTHSVLRVKGPAPGVPSGAMVERLIPFVGAYVGRVDLAQRRVEVDWGLDWGFDA